LFESKGEGDDENSYWSESLKEGRVGKAEKILISQMFESFELFLLSGGESLRQAHFKHLNERD